MKQVDQILDGLLKRAKEVIKQHNRYLSTNQTMQLVPEDKRFRLNIKQNKVEDSVMPNIKNITVTFHINEDTGSVVNATRPDGSPGASNMVPGGITDCHAFVVSHNSPSCIWIKIGGVWYQFC
jgi:Na+-translocating ferredoxin:NAD+ oxidoreductase RnfG subunit